MSEQSRILVVDDEPRGVELLVRTLRRFGQVLTASSGEEAWDIARETELDLVISDQRMPGMSGVELLTRMAGRDEQIGRILLTGYADFEATTDSINRGRVHAYLTKPCSPEDVQMAVRQVLERVALSRENMRLVTDLSVRNRELRDALAKLSDAQNRVVHSERLAAMGRMAAMIVHDLRGPLTVIQAAAGNLADRRSFTGDELQTMSHEVTQESDRMQRMCSELLELTRVNEGGRRRRECIDEVVQSALAHMGEHSAQVGVVLDLDLGAEVEVELNEDAISRALRNLANNAVEAMQEGGGLLRVETRVEGDEVRVSVIDNGPGFPEAMQEQLFDPFVTHGKAGGSGLGLAVVKKVVLDHGGRVTASKPAAGGTCFDLYLPLQPGDPVASEGGVSLAGEPSEGSAQH